jgi:hypothetical protein
MAVKNGPNAGSKQNPKGKNSSRASNSISPNKKYSTAATVKEERASIASDSVVEPIAGLLRLIFG